MKVLKHEESDEWYGVLIQDGTMLVWMDVSKDFERIDWNKYIFHLDNDNDIKIKKYQEDIDNFENCSSLAVEYLENLKNK